VVADSALCASRPFSQVGYRSIRARLSIIASATREHDHGDGDEEQACAVGVIEPRCMEVDASRAAEPLSGYRPYSSLKVRAG
jgi:hypothetical protein